MPHGLGGVAPVDHGRLLEALVDAHEAGHVDQHHVSRVLPDRNEDQGEHRPARAAEQRVRLGPRERFADGDEGAVEDELPYVAEDDAADQIRDEESGAEEVLPLDAAGHRVGEEEGDAVDQYHGDDRVDDGPPQRGPVHGVGEGLPVIGQPDERLGVRDAVPAGEGQIDAVDERQHDDGAEQDARWTREYQELPQLVRKPTVFHYNSIHESGRGARPNAERHDPIAIDYMCRPVPAGVSQPAGAGPHRTAGQET